MDVTRFETLLPADPAGSASLEPASENSLQNAAAPQPTPRPLEITQPIAVYLQWLLIGVVGLSYALLFPVSSAIEDLARALPRWSQVAGAAALATFALAAIERGKRDRSAVQYALNACTLMFAILAAQPSLQAGRSTRVGWYLVPALSLCGLAHLLWLEDWVSGRSGPRFRHLAASVRDLATARWWFWFSKAGIALRAERRLLQSQLRAQRERDWAERRSAEDQAAKAAAERKRREDLLSAARAEEEAAQSERLLAAERQRADDAGRQAAEAEELRLLAEMRVAAARSELEDLHLQAQNRALDRLRLKTEQMEADRRFLDAASATVAAAETAYEQGAELARAEAVLERATEELILFERQAE